MSSSSKSVAVSSSTWALSVVSKLAATIEQEAVKRETEILKLVARKYNIDMRELLTLVSTIDTDLADNINGSLDVEKRKIAIAVSKAKDKSEGNTCQHVLGSRSQREGQTCGKAIKNGMTYCTPHVKAHAEKTPCTYILSDKCKNAGQECGCRASDEDTSDDVFEDYVNQPLCTKHIKALRNQAERANNSCTYVGVFTGKRCTTKCMDDTDCCRRHQPKPKKAPKEKVEKEVKAQVKIAPRVLDVEYDDDDGELHSDDEQI